MPTDTADHSLRKFSAQSGLEVVFAADAPRGIRTNAVRGEYTPETALTLLLERTGLTAIQDRASGAFLVNREPVPNVERAAPAIPRSVRPPKNPEHREAEDEPVALSPFVVNSDSDVGYVATSSLAGSRMNTSLKDTAASISIMTAEFLSDLGITDLTEALEWGTNMALDQPEDNAALGQGNDNSTFEHFGRARVRGMPATITRNYFAWRLPADTYNIDRIEEQRGPNSILFGIGSSGGVVNASTKQPSLGRTFRRANLMLGDYNTYRGSFDINQPASDRKFAVRINGVYSNRGHYRQHAYNDTQRIHLAAAFRPSPAIRMRVEFETGDVEQVVARNASLFDGLSAWKAAPLTPAGTSRGADGALVVTNPAGVAAFQGISRYPNTVRLTYVGGTGETVNMQNRNSSAGPGRAILDPALVDDTINTGGPGQRRHGYFRTMSAFYEQQFGRRMFVELAYNHQEDSYKSYILSQGAIEGNQLRADVNQVVSGGDNPNLGRYMLEGIWNHWKKESRSDNTRVTASADIEAGKWGNYRIAAMGEYEARKAVSRTFREVWAGAPFAATPEAAANNVFRRSYVTPGDWASYMVSGPAATGLLRDVPNPAPAAIRAGVGPMPTLSSTWAPFNQNQIDEPEYQTTALLGGQARYFRGRVVAGMGFRQDRLKFTDRGSRRNPVTQAWETDYANYTHERYSGTTRTLGLVGHVTPDISVFYSTSNNFSLPTTNVRIAPDSRVAGNPESSGQDYGVAFSLFGDRVNLRVNYYETENDTHGFRLGGTANNPTVLLNRILDTLSRADVGILTPAQADSRRMDTTGTTFQQYVEGYELRLTANPTKNWRLQANYSYTNGYETDIAPEVVEWAAATLPEYERHGALVSNVDNQTIAQLIAAWRGELADTVEQDGLSLPGNRKHKVNVFTRYTFDRSAIRGLYLGAGYRHQSKRASNVTASRELVYGNSYWLANAVAGYRFRKLWFARDLSLQLNVENLFDYDEPIVLRREPTGQIARWSVIEPRTWRLTAGMQF